MTGSGSNRIYMVGGRQSDSGLTPEMVGGKAANLARLDRLGLRVPPALALPASLCRDYMDRGTLPNDLRTRLAGSIRQVERLTGCSLGGRRPLLVSVRSSPPSSMPGMLSTVLNVGINEDGVRGLVRRTGNPWLAWDVYRRFARSFTEMNSGHSCETFDRIVDDRVRSAGVSGIQDLDAIAMREVARASASLVPSITGAPLPADPLDQMMAAIEAVLRSWASAPAREYRRLNGLDEHTGTGVLIQTMVFGNNGSRSGSGVGFTRNPATGVHHLYADFLFNAQGEDVVAGRLPVIDSETLPAALPQIWTQLTAAGAALEREFRDMQDFEFTVDDGQLYFLQSRSGKRTPWAALRIATDLVREDVLDPATALERLRPYALDEIVRVVVRPGGADRPMGRATPASVGVAIGRIVFDAARAQELAADGPVILVRTELTTDDVAGVAAATGILTTFGGRTSHAAVVARQLGKVCLVGCGDLRVDENARACLLGADRLNERDVVTLDGETGLIYRGEVPVVTERPVDDLAMVESWREERFPLVRV